MLQTGQVFAGYVIKRVLGHGGMGTVYLAQHPRLPRLTALKLLKRELYRETEIRRRFEREADLVAGLDHPNIVTVFDRGTEDEQLWISMQYVPGADASCADVNVLAPGRAVQIISDTAIALDFAHANQVLHRDVKPANILLAKAPIGQPERVLLTDFGIAGVRGSDTTIGSAGSITATLAFGAPEQLMGQPLDDRADQYSLACTLFWLLTGVAPYPGANPAAVVNSHLYAPIPVLSRMRPGLPPELDRVLARAMAKRPADRFADCAEFAAAARHALAAGTPRRPAGPVHNARPGPIPPTRTFLPPSHSTVPPGQTGRLAPAPHESATPPTTSTPPPPRSVPPGQTGRRVPAPHEPATPPTRSAPPPPSSVPPPTSVPPPGSPVPPPPRSVPPDQPGRRAPAQHESTTPPTRSTPPPPRSVPPATFLPPRRPVRRGTIELPDLPMRPGATPRRQAPPPDARPPPIAIGYRMSLA
ncbi:serine/threonine-protein kinase [Nocardia sp. NPDC006044]|uniref:serine/threonine-protein kinase n=1 Tax=Nocardia sp. NPDC006044 TaxID=3364306 RepID=UPI00368858B2